MKPKINASKTSCFVYDVLNCRPRNRFTIWTDRGPLIVHNCGFQMGPPKFQSSCKEKYGLDLPIELCELAVKVFRETHDRVRSLWYQLDHDAKAAIRGPGVKVGRFIVRQLAGMPYLLMQLPSGRTISYPRPEIVVEKVATYVARDFTDEEFEKADRSVKTREQIHYWGQLPQSVHYGPVKLYGGKLAENLTMGVEADIMNHGLITAEKRGMPPFMLVHDQALALRINGKTAEDFSAALVGDLPAWAKGLPIKVESRIAPYYKK